MDTITVEVGSIKAVVSGLTNGADILQRRMYRTLADKFPQLQDKANIDRDVAEFIGRFVASARIISIEGLPYSLPTPFSSKEDILMAFARYSADKPDFWEKLSNDVWERLDRPSVPEEQQALDNEARKDPNE